MPPSLPSSPNGNYLISPELPRGLTSNDSCDGDFNPQAPVGPDLGGALKGTIAERRRFKLLNTKYFLREYCTPSSSTSSERNLLGEHSHGYGDGLYNGTPSPRKRR